MTIILAGDIGGTKTNLGLFRVGKRRPVSLRFESFPSPEASGLEAILEVFLTGCEADIAGACFGIAGPVQDGRSRTTNLPWEVSENEIKRRFGWKRVRLVNDLVATALAIPALRVGEMNPLNRARPAKGGNIGILAPGTGLGVALVARDRDNRIVPIPSEGGHGDFPPSSESQLSLWRYLNRRFGHVSLERLLSGAGIHNIYQWHRDVGKYREPQWLTKALGVDDPGKVIVRGAGDRKNPICIKTIKTFVSILGAAAGNLALTGMTTGGIFLGGGIPPKILEHLREKSFMESFVDKGRFRAWMERIPVKVILNDRAALMGAAICASELMI
jgi:glucokinase